MPKRTSDYNSWRTDKLSSPENAVSYLNAAINDSPQMFLKALRNVAQARFQMTHVAKGAGVTRETLYKSLSDEGNPTWATLNSVFNVLQLRFDIAQRSVVKPTPIAAAKIKASGYHYSRQRSGPKAQAIKREMTAARSWLRDSANAGTKQLYLIAGIGGAQESASFGKLLRQNGEVKTWTQNNLHNNPSTTGQQTISLPDMPTTSFLRTPCGT